LNDLDAALVALDTYRELSGVVSEEVLDTIFQDLTRVLRERFDVVWEAARQYNNVEYVLDPTFVEALDSYNPANFTKESELADAASDASAAYRANELKTFIRHNFDASQSSALDDCWY